MKKMTDLDYMRLSIEEMRKSIQESRNDEKISPKVGAVLVRNDGSYVAAHRGELREGDHAEYTLLERVRFETVFKTCPQKLKLFSPCLMF